MLKREFRDSCSREMARIAAKYGSTGLADVALDAQTVLPSPMVGTDCLGVGRAGVGYTGNARQVIGYGGAGIRNQSFADQAAPAAATTLLTGSILAIPTTERVAVGSWARWTGIVSKTAAGIAVKSLVLKFGINGTTADATILTFALPAGTAVVDLGYFELIAGFRAIGAAAVLRGYLFFYHNLATTGLINVQQTLVQPAASAGFNSAVDVSKLSLAFVAGAAEAWTFTQLTSELYGV